MNKNYKCTITLFTSISLILIIGLLFSLTEIARMKVCKLYMTINCCKAGDSLLSMYHKKLWDYYNIFGLESYDNDLLKDEYMYFLNIPIFDNNSKFYNNYYIANIKNEDVKLKNDYLIENTNFEDEIVSFMKYGIVRSFIDFAGKNYDMENLANREELEEEVFDTLKIKNKNIILENMYEKYFDFKNEITKLENDARVANTNIDKYIELVSKKRFSESGSESGAKNNKNMLTNMDDFLNTAKNKLYSFKNSMEILRAHVEESRMLYEKEKAMNEEIDEDVDRFILDEFDIFEDYVDEGSELNINVENEISNIDGIKDNAYDAYIEATRIYENIKSANDEIKSVKKDKDLDAEERSDILSELNDELDELYDETKEFGKELNNNIDSFNLSKINIMVSDAKSSEKLDIFDKILKLSADGLLGLCLDNDEIQQIDDDNNVYKNYNIYSKKRAIEKILLSEYELNYFNFFLKEKLGLTTKSGSKYLEVEYLLSGENSDQKSIKSVTSKIILMREACNLLHIINSSEKKMEARTMINTLFAPCTIVVKEAMYIIVISAWALAQSIDDTSKIYDLKRVPIIHNDETWTYDINNILNLSRDMVRNENYEAKNGLNYKDYLRLLLCAEGQDIINSRMSNIIERNIKNEQDDFGMDQLIFGIDFEHTFWCKHYFTDAIIYSANNEKLYDDYQMKIKTHYDYIE